MKRALLGLPGPPAKRTLTRRPPTSTTCQSGPYLCAGVMPMTESGSASVEAHHRTRRGFTAVREYLQAQFRGYVVAGLGRDGSARRFRTFTVREDGLAYIVRVTDEVLDLDTEGAGVLLRKFEVARALREEGLGKVVVVTTTGIRVEPL
jgi:hypothetical protein